MPRAGVHGTLADYLASIKSDGQKGFWTAADAYIVSLLKAWFGDAATKDNDFGFNWLPRISGDHGTYQTTLDMLDDTVEGYFLLGQNPAVGSANGKLQRKAMSHLKWLVVRDFNLIESATFWKDGPEIATGELRSEDIGTEVFFLPAAAHTEKDGTFTQTQRMLQWHHKAVEPAGDCRSELQFFYQLGKRLRAKLAASRLDRDAALRNLMWDYPEVEGGEPDAAAVLREINGEHLAGEKQGELLSTFVDMKADGSTSGGCWIYTGVYTGGVNQSATTQAGVGAILGCTGMGVGVADEPAHSLQPCIGGPGRQAVERAQGVRLVGRAGPEVDRPRRSGLPGDQGAVVPTGGGHRRPGGTRRRRSVHHAVRRQGLVVRTERAARRSAAGALRAARITAAQCHVHPAIQPELVRCSRATRTSPTRRFLSRGRRSFRSS